MTSHLSLPSVPKNWEDFTKSSLPTRKNEYWKYADLTFLTNKQFTAPTKLVTQAVRDYVAQYRTEHADAIYLVTVNGYFAASLSDLNQLPANVIVNDAELSKTATHLYLSNELNTKQYPFASFNRGMNTGGLFISIPNNQEITKPIHLLAISADDQASAMHPRNVIMLGEQSNITLIEEYVSLTHHAYLNNIVNSFFLQQDANLAYLKIQNENNHVTHLATTFIQQLKNSQLDYINISVGASFAREDFVVKLLASGAECKTAGFYRLKNDNQYIDHHVDIHHLAPNSNSEMLYKGILAKKSRAVFNGRLYVAKDAQKILAYQANHHMLLSAEAEAYSKPELEIYADDVRCKHGATAGQLDQDALFYLRARGISEADALNILLEGFAEDILQRTKPTGLTQYLRQLVRAL